VPDISLLEPMVLNRVVQKFVTPQDLALLNTIPSRPSDGPDYVAWDIEKGARQLAGFNVPGAEAILQNQLGNSSGYAKLAYSRIKKTFQGQLLRWLREPGTINQTNAERKVMRELQGMSDSIDLEQEYLLWNALRGSSTIAYQDGSSVTINYQFPSSHLVSPAVVWSSATPQNIVDDVFAWKRLVETHGRVPATDAYCSSVTVQKIIDAWVNRGVATVSLNTGGATSSIQTNAAPNSPSSLGAAAVGGLLSDTMKDAYYKGQGLPGFMGLDWHAVDELYTNTAGNNTRFVGDGTSGNPEVFLGNYTQGQPVTMVYGKSPDLEAGDDVYGKFTKSWLEKDPSARVVLMELQYLPIVERPEQFIYCSNAG
jgi:hypothetical protein